MCTHSLFISLGITVWLWLPTWRLCEWTMCWHALTLFFVLFLCVCHVCIIRVGPSPAAGGAWEDSARDLDERATRHQHSHTEPQPILLTQNQTARRSEGQKGGVNKSGEDINKDVHEHPRQSAVSSAPNRPTGQTVTDSSAWNRHKTNLWGAHCAAKIFFWVKCEQGFIWFIWFLIWVPVGA